MFDITTLDYSWLISIYTLPNLMLCFFSGHIIEKLGLRASNMVTLVSMLLGQTVFVASLITQSFPLGLLGRILVG